MNQLKFSRLLELVRLMPISVMVSLVVGKIPARADTNLPLYIAQAPLPSGTELPSTPLPPTREDPSLAPLPPIEDFLDTPPERLPEGEAPESEVELEVREFQLEENTVLKETELETIFQDYRNRPITFVELLE